MFLVWSIDRVPKLYQLKLQCVNGQLNENQMICKTELFANFQIRYRNGIKVNRSRYSLFMFFSGIWCGLSCLCLKLDINKSFASSLNRVGV